MAASSRAWFLFAGLAIAAAASDLVSKAVAFSHLGMPGSGRATVLVPDVLVLETNLNEGALFGLGQGLGWAFAAVSVVAVIGILVLMGRSSTQEDAWMVAALGLIVGGILGNLYDRVGLPRLVWHAPPHRAGEPVRAVRDWIHFQVPGVIDWPIFNLADSWLVIGAGILLLLALRTAPPGAGSQADGDRP